MKEWKTTVGDYVREVKDAHGNLLKNVLFALLPLAILLAGWGVDSKIKEFRREKLIAEYTLLFEEMQGHYLDMCGYMEEGDYASAFAAAAQAFDSEARIYEWRATVWMEAGKPVTGYGGEEEVRRDADLLQQLFEEWRILAQDMTDGGRHREVVELVRGSLQQMSGGRFSLWVLQEGAALVDELQRAYLLYSGELMEVGEYREAAEILLESFYLFAEETEYESPAELYAEELRAAGDEAGAEAWEAHVRAAYLRGRYYYLETQKRYTESHRITEAPSG